MHKQKGAVEIILVFLLVAALGLAGYFWWQGRQEQNESTSTTSTSSEETSDRLDTSSSNLGKEPTKISGLVSTDGWQALTYKEISFLVPPDARTEESDYEIYGVKKVLFIYQNKDSVIPAKIVVRDYLGGSRREQYLSLEGVAREAFLKDCKPLFVDALFGSVKALQIANNGGECQGGGGGMVAVVGKKFFIWHDLNYDDETGVIHRSSIRDTIISTLKPL